MSKKHVINKGTLFSRVGSLYLCTVLVFNSCFLFKADTRAEIEEAFAEFDCYPAEHELDYFVDNYDRDVSLAAIYRAVVEPYFFVQVPGSALLPISMDEFVDSLNDLVKKYKNSSDYSDTGLDHIFGSRTAISGNTAFKPHEAVLLISMILALGSVVSDSGKTANLVSPLQLSGDAIAGKANVGKLISAAGLWFGAVTAGVLVIASSWVTIPVIIVTVTGMGIAYWVAETWAREGLSAAEEPFVTAMNDGVKSVISGYAAYNPDTKETEVYDYLGAIEVTSRNIAATAYDHATVDGDRVKISLNRQVVVSDLNLVGPPGSVVNLSLKSGMNTLTVLALNEGSVSPNTATLVLPGNNVKEWDLHQNESATVFIHAP